MAVAAGLSSPVWPASGRAGRAWDTGAPGSLVLRRMDRRGNPDGHSWEVAYNPHWTIQKDGRVSMTKN